MKKLYAILTISILANIAFALYVHMAATFFGADVFFSYETVKVSGVFIFNDRSKQPDPKKHVQHIFIKCSGKVCSATESIMSGEFIHMDTQEAKLLDANYVDKTATLETMGCRIAVAGDSASFTCKDGDVGAIASHIHLFHENYGFLKGWF